jgi:hypothetical protein
VPGVGFLAKHRGRFCIHRCRKRLRGGKHPAN